MNRNQRRRKKKQQRSADKRPLTPEQRGNALAAKGHMQEAVEAFGEAVTLDPRNLRAWSNLGSARYELGQPEAAAEAYKRALDVDSESVPVLSNLAMLMGQMGEIKAAIALYRQILQLAPREAEIYYDTALLKPFTTGDPEIAAMEDLLQKGSIDDQATMFLGFALAMAYEGVGDYDRAFEHMVRSNRLKRARLPFDIARDEDLVERLIATFDKLLMNEHVGQGDPSERPIFIVGMPRSGSTLIEQILASHSSVHGGGEMETIRDVVMGLAGAGTGLAGMAPAARPFPEGVADLKARHFRRLGEDYGRVLDRVAPAVARVTDKMPRNFFFAGLINLALPNAKLVHSTRSAVDTCLSCYAHHFPKGQEFTYGLVDLGQYYRLYDRLMMHWQEVLAERVLDIAYEQVVADPETETRRLLKFCGLEWENSCLSFHRTKRLVTTASTAQVRQPIYKNSVRKWKHYEHNLGPLLDALGPLVDDGCGNTLSGLGNDTPEKGAWKFR